jgi:hypothetical protein
MLSNGRRWGDEAALFLGIPGGAAAGGAAARNTRAVDRADTPDRRADGVADNDQEAQARVATFRDVQKPGWIEGRNIRIDARWPASNAVDRTRREEMAISLSVLSIACFIGAAISFLRYDSKYFDLLVLSGVIFVGTAMPSFEVDASLEELKSINHNLVNIQTAIENLQRK